MATYTSTQTGLWNDSATWGGGGYPDTADDIANVRHKVEYNITDSGSPFLGDVNIQWSNNNYTGHLAHQTGTYLNLNGRLNLQGGNYEMADDVTLAFTGNNSPDHGVYIYNGDRVSFYAKGTTPVAETRMSSSGSIGDYYIPVEDASNFETGDWISVFFRYNDLKSKEDFFNEVNYPSGVIQAEGVLNTGQYAGSAIEGNTSRLYHEMNTATDEGFIIHDINSDDIYVRDLVGPESSITKATSTKITVEDASVFRNNQRIIFGTGSKRTTSKITNINYRNNKITLEDNLSSTDVVGEKVYLGSLKIHKHKRTVVRTVGNQVTAEAAASATTITLNNVGDYSVGDKFYVEHTVQENDDWATVMPNGNTSWYNDIQIRHEITGISGNTLTFTPALPYKVYSGAFAYKANRPITIKAASDDPSDGTCKPYFYAADNGNTRTISGRTMYRRKFLIKDVQFLGIGNSNGSFQYYTRGGFNDGYFSRSCSHEGIVTDPMGNTHAYYFRFDGGYYHTYRNCINTNWYRCFYGGREGVSVVNSVGLNGRRIADAFGVQNVGGKVAYMRLTRGRENFRIYHRSMGQHISAYQIYAENQYRSYSTNVRSYMFQCHFKMQQYLLWDLHPDCTIAYCKLEQISTDNSKQRYFSYGSSGRLGYYPNNDGGVVTALDYKKDNDYLFKGMLMKYDPLQGAYEVTGAGGGYQHPVGPIETIVIEPNETVTISVEAKLHENTPGTSWTYTPFLLYHLSGHTSGYRDGSRNAIVRPVDGGDHQGYDFDYIGDPNTINANMLIGQSNYGNVFNFNFDNGSFPNSFSSRDLINSKTEFKKQTITVTNEFQFPAHLGFGLCSISSNSAYGWYMKPYVIARSESTSFMSKLGLKLRRILPSYMTKGTVAKRQKRRIGGARL